VWKSGRSCKRGAIAVVNTEKEQWGRVRGGVLMERDTERKGLEKKNTGQPAKITERALSTEWGGRRVFEVQLGGKEGGPC